MNLNPVWQMTLGKLRELLREPEALFWVFVFPVLLALGLGIAFRSAPAEVLPVAVQASERAEVFHAQPDRVHLHVTAAAQFDGKITAGHTDHAHLFAVFFTEGGYRAFLFGGGDRQHFRVHGALALDGTDHALFDFDQLLGGALFVMGEVEAQIVGSHQRTRLENVIAQMIAQGFVE